MTEFAVSEFTFWDQTFEEDVDLLLRTNIKYMELCERKLSVNPEKAREQLVYLKSTSLRVSSIQPRTHAVFPDFMNPTLSDPHKRAKELCKTIDLMSKFFQGVPLVTITGAIDNGCYREAWETIIDIYRFLADYAADKGVKLMFEPLHFSLMNKDTFICTMQDAMRLINMVNKENFGLMLDLFHVFHEYEIEKQILQLGDLIFGVHVSDYPKDNLRLSADRLIPGDGCIDFPLLINAVEQSGYQGAYCLEIFSDLELPDSIWKMRPESVIEKSRRYLSGL